MTEYKASVLLAHGVHKKIKWFTENLNTEIGAVGTVSIRTIEGNKYFYVEELFFPEQNVTGATVHFTGAQWKSIFKQLKDTPEKLGRINFYWHRHPGGNPGHSSTDEEETYDTFMGDEAKRPYFIFMQTAWGDDKMKREARIDVRNPIRHTVLDEDISILMEKSTTEEALRKEYQEKLEALSINVEGDCKKIEEECIVKPTYSWGNYRGGGLPGQHKNTNINDRYRHAPVQNKSYAEGDVAELKTMYENVEDEKDRFYIDNDLMSDLHGGQFATADDENVALEFKEGGVLVKAGEQFQIILEIALKPTNGLGKLTRPLLNKPEISEKDKHLKIYKLQPIAKSYKDLKTKILTLFVKFNERVRIDYEEELEEETGKENSRLTQMVNAQQPKSSEEKAVRKLFEQDNTENRLVIIDCPEDVQLILGFFETIGTVLWDQYTDNVSVSGEVKGEYNEWLGSFNVDSAWNSINVYGVNLVFMVSQLLEGILKTKIPITEIKTDKTKINRGEKKWKKLKKKEKKNRKQRKKEKKAKK